MTFSLLDPLEQRIVRGDELRQQGRALEALTDWTAAWALVRQRAGPEIRSVTEFERVAAFRRVSFVWWCMEFGYNLEEAAADAVVDWEDYLGYCREVTECFPDPIDHPFLAHFLAGHGDALLTMGRYDEAVRHFEAALRRLPDHPLLKARMARRLPSMPDRTGTYLITMPMPQPARFGVAT